MIGKTNKQTNRDYYFIYTDAIHLLNLVLLSIISSYTPNSSTYRTDIKIY